MSRPAGTLGLAVLVVIAASVSAASSPDAVERAIAWLRSARPDPSELKWPYHFGASPVCDPEFHQFHLVVCTIQGEPRNCALGDLGSEFLVTDPASSAVWLFVSKGHFGAAHYCGPLEITESGELRPSKEPWDCTS